MKTVLLCCVLGAWPFSGAVHAQVTSSQQAAGAPALGLALTGGASSVAGGGDDCSLTDVISGQGAHAYDTTLATTGAEGQAECGSIGRDVWFSWTADATGLCTVSTCGASFDTKLAVYAGVGCPADGTSIACNDDFCLLQSSVQFSVTSGALYTIQLGSFGATAGGTGMLDIIISQPAPNDDCSLPITLTGQGSFQWDSTVASAGAEGQLELLCDAFGVTGIDNDVWYTWTADQDGVALLSTCGTTFDSKIAAYVGSGCPAPGSALACDDDSCALQSRISFDVLAGHMYTLQLGTFPGSPGGVGLLDIQITSPASGYQYDLGVSTNSLGLPGGAIAWLQGFDAGAGDLITKVATAYGTPLYPGLPAGQSVVVCVWDDPTNDFDPTDANLLWSSDQLSALEDTDVLVEYSAPEVAVEGIFFVGVVHDGALGGYPAAMDETFVSGGRAWLVGNTVGSGGFGSFDLHNLNANDLPPQDMDTVGFPSVFILRAEGRSGLGTSYCMSAPNSTGSASVITAEGSTSLITADLLLHASAAPALQPGIFFFGEMAAASPFGNGTLCAGGTIRRCPVIYESGGEFTYDLDFDLFGPLLGSGGASTFFQCWYRDPVAGGAYFNTSDGLEITMTP